MTAAAKTGSGWSALEVSPKRWVVSVATESEVLGALTDFLTAQGITSGSITGLGAAHRVTISFRDPVSKAYIDTVVDEQMEVVNLTGNVSTVDGALSVHLHGTFGKQDLSAIAGHVKEVWIRGAGEIIVSAYDEPTHKVLDEGTGLNLYRL